MDLGQIRDGHIMDTIQTQEGHGTEMGRTRNRNKRDIIWTGHWHRMDTVSSICEDSALQDQTMLMNNTNMFVISMFLVFKAKNF